jgi:pimeloyl-ACP methyl ester carboxylesterase
MTRPRDRHAQLRGLRFHYLDWGTAGLPPVLLLHGGAQTAHSYDEVAPTLARTHDVVSLDQRGHGDTSWHRAIGARTSPATSTRCSIISGGTRLRWSA